MMVNYRLRFMLAVVFIALVGALSACGDSQTGSSPSGGTSGEEDVPTFRIAWSIYVGWMPWAYAEQSGILNKWAKKYGIKIKLVQVNDYIESINQYTAGSFDGCVMTNMDALTIPAAGGVDSTALIAGDFSNGNDGVILKNDDQLKDIKGKDVNLVALSVSHYLLARALASVGLSEKDVQVVNTSDADIVGAFQSSGVKATVTWNPQLSAILDDPNAKEVFDSSQIPGEIIDLMVVKSGVLKAHPKLGKALVGAWYQTMARMSGGGDGQNKALTAMAKAAGTDLAGYRQQLDSTRMFYKAQPAVDFATSTKLVKTMDKVRQFAFNHGLMGEGAPSADVIGMRFPNGRTLGDKGNIKLRFNPTYMRMAAQGKLEDDATSTQ